MKKTGILILLIASLFLSCKKAKEDPITDYGVAAENSQTQSDFEDMHRIAEDVMDGDNASMRTESASCWTSSINTSSKVITVTFDSTLCVDGKTRDGMLQITYTGKYRTSGTVITIVPVGYSVNGRSIAGKKTVTNLGNTGVNGSMRFSVVVSDAAGTGFASITYPDGGSATWKSSRTRDWTGGDDTPSVIYDDVYQINGTGEGIAKGGTSYTTTFTNIVVKLACWSNYIYYPVSGVVALTTSEGTRSIDYGNGVCDKTVTYHGLKGQTLTFTLD